MSEAPTIPGLPEAQKFYPNSALYTQYAAQNDSKQRVFEVLYAVRSIDLYCMGCRQHSVFQPVENRPEHHHYHRLAENGDDWNVDLEKSVFIVEKQFRCSRNTNHLVVFFTQLKYGKVFKVGQSISLADLAEQDIRQYKKVLGDENYHEFSKAVGLYSHGVGVGSFVYLRRIVENMIVKPAHERAQGDAGWDEEAYSKSRVKEKIDMLKGRLPAFLVENKSIYSVLSLGIHELTEEQCKSYFPVLRSCLELILTELESLRIHEAKRKDMESKLSRIAADIATGKPVES